MSERVATKPQALCQINRTAERLDVSRSTIYRLVRAKQLVLVRIGQRASRITEESITDYLDSLAKASATR